MSGLQGLLCSAECPREIAWFYHQARQLHKLRHCSHVQERDPLDLHELDRLGVVPAQSDPCEARFYQPPCHKEGKGRWEEVLIGQCPHCEQVW